VITRKLSGERGAPQAALLSLEPDIEVVADVGRGDEVVGACQAFRPDLALLDIEMPGIDGLEAALSEGASPLTPRETEVLAAARGRGTIADIARGLRLSPGTACATTCRPPSRSSAPGPAPRPSRSRSPRTGWYDDCHSQVRYAALTGCRLQGLHEKARRSMPRCGKK
jgi:CheY-like chemotaxis protein